MGNKKKSRVSFIAIPVFIILLASIVLVAFYSARQTGIVDVRPESENLDSRIDSLLSAHSLKRNNVNFQPDGLGSTKKLRCNGGTEYYRVVQGSVPEGKIYDEAVMEIIGNLPVTRFDFFELMFIDGSKAPISVSSGTLQDAGRGRWITARTDNYADYLNTRIEEDRTVFFIIHFSCNYLGSGDSTDNELHEVWNFRDAPIEEPETPDKEEIPDEEDKEEIPDEEDKEEIPDEEDKEEIPDIVKEEKNYLIPLVVAGVIIVLGIIFYFMFRKIRKK